MKLGLVGLGGLHGSYKLSALLTLLGRAPRGKQIILSHNVLS